MEACATMLRSNIAIKVIGIIMISCILWFNFQNSAMADGYAGTTQIGRASCRERV